MTDEERIAGFNKDMKANCDKWGVVVEVNVRPVTVDVGGTPMIGIQGELTRVIVARPEVTTKPENEE